MGTLPWRTMLAFLLAVALSLFLFIFLTRSPYIFALGLALGAYLAQIATFKEGAVFGAITSLPLALYLAWTGLMPADSDEFFVILNALLLIAFGALYCGVITWLIQSLKKGRVFFS